MFRQETSPGLYLALALASPRVSALLPEGWALEPLWGFRVQEKSHQQGNLFPDSSAAGQSCKYPFYGFQAVDLQGAVTAACEKMLGGGV